MTGSGRRGRGGRRRTAAAPRPSAAPGCRPDSPSRRSRPRRSDSDAATSSSSVAWSDASSRCRPREVRRTRTSCPSRAPRPPSLTHRHLANENVDALIRRPSTGGTRNPDDLVSRQPGQRGSAEGQRDHRHRGVLDRRQLCGRDRRQVAEQPGGRGGWCGEDDAVGPDQLGLRAWRRRRARSRQAASAAPGPWRRSAP